MAHRPKPKKTGVGRSGASRYQAALKKWEAEHKAGAKAPTAKDKEDARKEKETSKLPKPKPKPKPQPKPTNGNGKAKNGNGTTKPTNGNGKTKPTNGNGKTKPTNGGKVTGIGPVASGKEYGKHLDERAKKEKLKAKTPEAKKPAKKMSRLEKQNRARHGDKAIDHLKKKNSDFQAMKKGKMKKSEFIKKYPRSITAQKAAGLRRR